MISTPSVLFFYVYLNNTCKENWKNSQFTNTYRENISYFHTCDCMCLFFQVSILTFHFLRGLDPGSSEANEFLFPLYLLFWTIFIFLNRWYKIKQFRLSCLLREKYCFKVKLWNFCYFFRGIQLSGRITSTTSIYLLVAGETAHSIAWNTHPIVRKRTPITVSNSGGKKQAAERRWSVAHCNCFLQLERENVE